MYNCPMKHAYLIIAHHEFDILNKLIQAIDDERNDIFIHFDKKVIDPKNNVLIKKAHWKEFNIQPSLQGKRLIKENKDDKEAKEFYFLGEIYGFLC